MKIFFTNQALQSLEEALAFLSNQISKEKQIEIRDAIIDATKKLSKYPKMGKKEEYLAHLSLNHRRIIQGNYKIIYRIEENIIYITDVFDTRQDPNKMKE